jgi:hypothetical protein
VFVGANEQARRIADAFGAMPINAGQSAAVVTSG